MPYSLNYSELQTSFPKSEKLPPPPNFDSPAITGQNVTRNELAKRAISNAQLKEKRAWDLAIAPAKSLPMNAFMLYMSGNSLQIFSIGILVMLLMNPFKSVMGINSAFAPLAPTSSSSQSFTTLFPQKAVYIACNLLTLGLGLYKCRSLGLLPTGSGDWLAFETRGLAPEISL